MLICEKLVGEGIYIYNSPIEMTFGVNVYFYIRE